MRILVISPGVLPLPPVLGGAVENLIARLHSHLSRSYELHYASVAIPSPSSEAKGMPGARLHYIDSINPLKDFNVGNDFELQESDKWPTYERHCKDVAREIKPDIIHIHNEARLAIGLKQLLPKSRIIVHVNDEVVTRLDPSQLGRLASSADMILSCSDYIARQMARAFQMANVPNPTMQLFYNFVDCNDYDPARFSAAQIEELKDELGLRGAPVVLFVGRLIEQKGPHLALRALRWMVRHGTEARLLFVGAPWYSRDTQSPWVDFIRAEGRDLSDRMVFTGYVAQERIALYFALGDIAAVPSIWDDPSPFVAYEAQAMMKPVIASQRGGIPEIVADGETGRTIDVFNVPLFGQIMQRWIGDANLRERLGAAGRKRILANFTVEKAARQMDGVYRSLQT